MRSSVGGDPRWSSSRWEQHYSEFGASGRTKEGRERVTGSLEREGKTDVGLEKGWKFYRECDDVHEAKREERKRGRGRRLEG